MLLSLQLRWTAWTLYEESSEFKVAVFDLNVPWAQQAEKKSLIVGYKKQTIYLHYILSFRLDLQYYWVLTVDISGIAGFEKLAMPMTAAVKGGKGAGREQTNERTNERTLCR